MAIGRRPVAPPRPNFFLLPSSFSLFRARNNSLFAQPTLTLLQPLKLRLMTFCLSASSLAVVFQWILDGSKDTHIPCAASEKRKNAAALHFVRRLQEIPLKDCQMALLRGYGTLRVFGYRNDKSLQRPPSIPMGSAPTTPTRTFVPNHSLRYCHIWLNISRTIIVSGDGIYGGRGSACEQTTLLCCLPDQDGS
jgi:hypothetical protein